MEKRIKKITPPTHAEVMALEFRQIHNAMTACEELTMTAAAICVVMKKNMLRLKRDLAKRERRMGKPAD